ncbi:MAG TPA: AraC family transcriptional regulator [Thermoanaerobaculia bacterium]|nr:AraC family transcriptional regulator [Thermoanaerobaculia bacterium]
MATILSIPEVHSRPDTLASYRIAVEQVVLRMRERICEELPLERMAEMAGASPFHFLRIFRRFTGVPPVHFLHALRMEEAKRLLLTTDLSVTDICFEVGYNSLGTFTTRFTQLVGLSPTRMRRLGQGFRLEMLTGLADRLGAAAPMSSPSSLTGRVLADDIASGPLFIGLFSTPIPQQRPLACTLLTRPGPFRLATPGPGRFFVFAACFAWTSDPVDFLLASRAVRRVASSGRVTVRAGLGTEPVDLHLRPLEVLDPPLLVALPLLVAERRERSLGDLQPLAQVPAGM